MIQGPLKELYIESITESGINPYSFHHIFQAKKSLRISWKVNYWWKNVNSVHMTQKHNLYGI